MKHLFTHRKDDRGGMSEATAVVVIAPVMMVVFLLSLSLFTFFETYSATYISSYAALRTITSAYADEISLAASNGTINDTVAREQILRQARTDFDDNMRGQRVRFTNDNLSQFDIVPLSSDYEYFVLQVTYHHTVFFGKNWFGATIPVRVNLVGRLQRMRY